MSETTAPPRQLPLDLPWSADARAGRADFIEAACNEAARVALAAPWPQGRLLLAGPEGSGKTHLALIRAAEAGARFLDLAALTKGGARAAATLGEVIVEDLDRRLAPDAEVPLFHLLNLAAEGECRVLMTARVPPSRWTVGLRDLASRLGATALAPLSRPDDTLLSRLVEKLLADRALRHDARLPGYVAKRIERSFAAAQTAVEALDAAALASGRPVSVAMAREALGW